MKRKETWDDDVAWPTRFDFSHLIFASDDSIIGQVTWSFGIWQPHGNESLPNLSSCLSIILLCFKSFRRSLHNVNAAAEEKKNACIDFPVT